MTIAVEGMDGVGKTTIAQYIAEKYNFDFIEKPLHYFYEDDASNGYNDFMRVATKMYNVNDNFIKSWYFGLGNMYVGRMFADKDVVIDRHLVSNYYWNGDSESEIIYQALIGAIGVPDLTILLYAKTETRMERLRKRDPNDPDLTDPDKKDDGYAKMLYFIEKFNLPCIVIDTENKDLDEVKQIVDEAISNLKENPKQFVKKDES